MFLGKSANLDNFYWKDSQHSGAFATGTSNLGTRGYSKCTAKQIPKGNSYWVCRGEQKAILIGVSWQFSCELLILLLLTITIELALLLPPITRISPGAQFLWQSSNVSAFSFGCFRLDGHQQTDPPHYFRAFWLLL